MIAVLRLSGEQVMDLAAEHPEVVARLTAIADAKRKELGDTELKIKGAGVRAPGRVEKSK